MIKLVYIPTLCFILLVHYFIYQYSPPFALTGIIMVICYALYVQNELKKRKYELCEKLFKAYQEEDETTFYKTIFQFDGDEHPIVIGSGVCMWHIIDYEEQVLEILIGNTIKRIKSDAYKAKHEMRRVYLQKFYTCPDEVPSMELDTETRLVLNNCTNPDPKFIRRERYNNPAIIVASKISLIEVEKVLERYHKQKKKCNVNEVGYLGRTAIMYACMHGAKDIFDYLIANGADLDKQDDYGNNCMHYLVASYAKHVYMATKYIPMIHKVVIRHGMPICEQGNTTGLSAREIAGEHNINW
jgi:hypothetical protein